MASSYEQQQPLHILFFPFIAPGHLIPVAAMAALFASRGIKCTILTTPANATVIRSAVDRANNNGTDDDAPAIHISTVPFPDVGLPPGVESVADVFSQDDLFKLMEAGQRLREPFDRFLLAMAAEHHHPRPDAVVVDSFYPWGPDVAAEHGIPRLCFLGSSLFARACADSLLRNDPFALAPEDDPDAVASLPELPHRVALRRSQVMDPRRNLVEWDFYQLADAPHPIQRVAVEVAAGVAVVVTMTMDLSRRWNLLPLRRLPGRLPPISPMRLGGPRRWERRGRGRILR